MEQNPLLGTWKLKSHVGTTATGERLTPFGENPTGYLSYSADGRMLVVGAVSGRTLPASADPSASERAALYDTMFAYAGRYSLDRDRVVHHVEISWNEAWSGTDQTRIFELSGNILTLKTRIPDPISGQETHYAVVWEKVAGPP